MIRLILTLALTFAGTAFAQGYPTRLVRIIVPWPPGGAIDVVARNLAQRLPARLGQQVIVENRAGSNGFIGTTAVAKADPDGYTLLFADVGSIAISPAMRTDTPYDPVRDFAPITLAVSAPFVLVVQPAVPAKTLADLVDYAKSRPGKLTYGSFGAGSIAHLSGAMLQSLVSGLELVHVPYKGAAPVITDLLGGQIDMAFISVASATPHLETGKLRGIAVTTVTRSRQLPALPAIAEIYPGYEVNSWYGMFAPARTPADVVARLHKEIAASLADPDLVQSLHARGFAAEASAPTEFAAKIQKEIASWARVVKAAGLVGAN